MQSLWSLANASDFSGKKFSDITDKLISQTASE